MGRTRVKICCMASLDEARQAIDAGADALGLVGAMPSGPGPIPDELIARVARAVPPPVATFLLTSAVEPAAIVDHARRCRTGTLQLVDRIAPEAYPVLRGQLPATKLVQVIHVEDESAIEQARALAPLVDALLLDSGRPNAAIRVLGGTGMVHDWAISRRIVETVDRPVFLAGGLNAANVGQAIVAVRPFAVDLCTGVRTDGRLDPAKLHAFMAAVRAASS